MQVDLTTNEIYYIVLRMQEKMSLPYNKYPKSIIEKLTPLLENKMKFADHINFVQEYECTWIDNTMK
jgi:hypothetical protein